MKKMLVCTILVVCILVSVLPAPASAAYTVNWGSCGPDTKWKLTSDGVLTISGKGEMASNAFQEPYWYEYRDDIVKVIIEPGVTTVGYKSFYNHRNLREVVIADTVTEICGEAFRYTNIQNLELPSGVKIIGNNAFYGACLYELVIPDSVVSVGTSAFRNAMIEKLVVPAGITDMGSNAFAHCGWLTEVEVHCPELSYGMFEGCIRLKTVSFGDSVTTIGTNAFKDCSQLTSLTIPANVTVLKGAITTGTNINHIIYGGSRDQWTLFMGNVTDYGLEGADKHFNTTEPFVSYRESCTVVVYHCARCQRDISYYLKGQRDAHNFEDDICTDCAVRQDIEYVVHEDGTVLILQFDGKDEVLVVPDQIEGLPVVEIRDLVEIHNDTTHTVVLPEGLKAIESSWLSDFPAMKTVTIPAAVEKLGRWAFSNMSHLESITFLGDKPEIDPDNFWRMDVTIYYPKDNETWTNLQQYRGTIRYVPYSVNPFEDVREGKYYYDAVLWAAENNITAGKTPTQFKPDDACTREQVVTFLWRAAGSPEPASMENPFTDVPADRFEKAILWAYHAGITAGKTSTQFKPDDLCTREQVVTFLHRYAGSPQPEDIQNPFTDVPADRFEKGILWAYGNNITAGKTATSFDPDGLCTRAQIVTFLYRYLGE